MASLSGGVFLPVGFAKTVSDEAAVGRDALAADGFEFERFVEGGGVFGLRGKRDREEAEGDHAD